MIINTVEIGTKMYVEIIDLRYENCMDLIEIEAGQQQYVIKLMEELVEKISKLNDK